MAGQVDKLGFVVLALGNIARDTLNPSIGQYFCAHFHRDQRAVPAFHMPLVQERLAGHQSKSNLGKFGVFLIRHHILNMHGEHVFPGKSEHVTGAIVYIQESFLIVSDKDAIGGLLNQCAVTFLAFLNHARAPIGDKKGIGSGHAGNIEHLRGKLRLSGDGDFFGFHGKMGRFSITGPPWVGFSTRICVRPQPA
ncbi:MAG TPA: hypothetical protein VMV97_00370 [Sulfuriferula sp.]|nr:hypothetical protein [Sulfuriferula sp.]